MKGSRPFPDIFEECLEFIVKGEAVETCLRRFPEHATQLRGLLETATAARKAMAVQPSPEFREQARGQMYAAMRERAAMPKRPVLSWSWQPRWAVVAAAFLALLVTVSGTALAANNSMPDQPLYAVKQATEQVRLVLTPSRTARAELYAGLADRRVNEIVYLAGKGKSERLQQVTRDLDSHLDRVTELAGTGAGTITTFTQNDVRLAAPEATAPAPAAVPPPVPTLAPATVPPATAPVPATEKTTAPSAGGAPDVTATSPAAEESATPPQVAIQQGPPPKVVRESTERISRLRARIAYQATQHPARLKAALTSAPPETRLALLKAIAVSETGYEMALQSLEGS